MNIKAKIPDRKMNDADVTYVYKKMNVSIYKTTNYYLY